MVWCANEIAKIDGGNLEGRQLVCGALPGVGRHEPGQDDPRSGGDDPRGGGIIFGVCRRGGDQTSAGARRLGDITGSGACLILLDQAGTLRRA